MRLTTFRLVAPHILPLLAVFGASGECSLSYATIRTLSPIVVLGNIYARMHNGLVPSEVAIDLVKESQWVLCSSKDASAGNVGGH